MEAGEVLRVKVSSVEFGGGSVVFFARLQKGGSYYGSAGGGWKRFEGGAPCREARQKIVKTPSLDQQRFSAQRFVIRQKVRGWDSSPYAGSYFWLERRWFILLTR